MNTELSKRILSSLILIPLSLFFIIKGSYLFVFFIIICFLIIAYEWQMMTRNKVYNFPGFIFLLFSFYSIYELRNNYYGDYLYLLLITLICVFTDIGGYIFGKLFQGPKLTKLSPKKTYSGMIGGYFMSIFFVSLIFNTNIIFSEINVLLTFNNLIFIILVSTISQLGDIFISYFKRLAKIKDTGRILPGHGGLLDRVDGMIFAFPFSFIILSTEIFKYHL